MNKIIKKNGSMKTPVKPWQAIICGVGGQGVLFVNRLLAIAAQSQGLQVLVSEVHGMAQRGGPVVSHLRAGGYHSPLTPMGQADMVFALEKGEAIRNIPYLAVGGKLVVNAPDLKFISQEAQKALRYFKVDIFCAHAEQLALELNAPLNILLLAAAARSGFLPVSESRLHKIIQTHHPDALSLWQRGVAMPRAA